jgi:hypothetical protein
VVIGRRATTIEKPRRRFWVINRVKSLSRFFWSVRVNDWAQLRLCAFSETILATGHLWRSHHVA